MVTKHSLKEISLIINPKIENYSIENIYESFR
jgi:hypothetical protein